MALHNSPLPVYNSFMLHIKVMLFPCVYHSSITALWAQVAVAQKLTPILCKAITEAPSAQYLHLHKNRLSTKVVFVQIFYLHKNLPPRTASDLFLNHLNFMGREVDCRVN